MARSFGSTGASSLLRTAEAEVNRVSAYNDAIAAYEWDQSAKTPEDFTKYKGYLDTRVSKTQNVDPTKALSLTRTASSAYRTYNSAEISRATTAVKYGDISNRDKYGRLGQLYQAAIANGDENQAQSLEGQMASLSVTIQNEEQAAAAKAEAGNNKTLAANKRGIDESVRAFDQTVAVAKDLVEQGKLSVQDYQRTVAQAATGKAQLLQDAASGKYGLSEDAMSGYADKHLSLTTSDEFKKHVALGASADSGMPSQYLKVDPATGVNTLQDLPAGKLVQDANGNVTRQYGGGFQGAETAQDRQKKLDSSNFDYIFPQVGSGAAANVTSNVGGTPVKDAKGNYFVVDTQGRKHYINPDPKALLQRSSTPIGDMPDFGPASGISWNPIENAKSLGSTLGGVAKKAGNVIGGLASGRITPGTVLNNLLTRDSKAKQQAADLAAATARNAALAAERERQTKLLPVFRAPAYLPPAPAPAPAKVAAYTPAPLPGQAGYVNAVDKTKTTIANPKSTARDALKSLIGF